MKLWLGVVCDAAADAIDSPAQHLQSRLTSVFGVLVNVVIVVMLSGQRESCSVCVYSDQ